MRPRPRKRRPASDRALVAAVRVLDERVRKLERAVGLDKRRCGFVVDAVGDRLEQDEDDGYDHVPDEVRRRASAGRRRG